MNTLNNPRLLALLAAYLIASCTAMPDLEISPTQVDHQIEFFSAETAIQDDWQPVPIRGETEYRIASVDGKVAIRATGRGAASGLMRRVKVDPLSCPGVSWSWRLEEIQESADIRVRDKEDVAASIFFLFGDPGFMARPVAVPALRYVWTNDKISVDSIVDSPYLPGVVKSLVVRSGSPTAAWQVEKRNIVDDFKYAFGHPRRSAIEAIALFTDNDQTKQPVRAYYEWARGYCQRGSTRDAG